MIMKPTKSEDNYIRVQEMQQRIAKLAKFDQAEGENRHLNETHWIHCPRFGQMLSPEKCGSVELDVCPACRSEWLDKDEMGTILVGRPIKAVPSELTCRVCGCQPQANL
jgi:hypothetical protein